MTITNVVTGAAGFLGFHLCKRLLEAGETVIGFDNLSSGSIENINLLKSQYEKFRFVQHDIRLDFAGFTPKIDRIWHLACQASPPAYQEDMLNTLDTCYLGTKHALQLAKNHNARILFTSTSEIYGDPLEHPQTEAYRGNVNTLGPRSCYDEGKRVAESLCYVFGLQHGVDYRIARIFNTYGPRMNPKDGRVITNFLLSAETDKTLTIYGDGLQTRSFCYVDDTIDGLILLMNSYYRSPVNIGNDDEFTINQLASKINTLYDNTLETIHYELPQDDPVMRRPDLKVAREVLNYEPKVSLDDGLSLMREWFKSTIGK